MMEKYVREICKIGQGNDCCRYLTVGGNGFECAKLGSLKGILDQRAKAKTMHAQSDNCDGLSDFTKLNKAKSTRRVN